MPTKFKLPLILADPVNGNAGVEFAANDAVKAYDAEVLLFEYDAEVAVAAAKALLALAA